MGSRQDGRSTEYSANHITAGSAGGGIQSADYMDYMSDMIQELRTMAEKSHAPVLAGILDLAYREARIEIERRSGR